MAGLLPFGSAPTPDATSTVKGKVQLAGDLTGTAAAPTIAAAAVNLQKLSPDIMAFAAAYG